jgi:hypothetical protein
MFGQRSAQLLKLRLHVFALLVDIRALERVPSRHHAHCRASGKPGSSEHGDRAVTRATSRARTVRQQVETLQDHGAHDGITSRNERPIATAKNGEWRKVSSVESRCGAVAVGSVCLLPPLSFGGARVT